jgi:ABC-2 type transport system permease protein/lipopolysaccharide transport system permease protein
MAPSDSTVDLGLLEEPPAEIRYRRVVHPLAALGELYRSRELVFTLAEREIRARYKQSSLGMSWTVLTPVLLMIVFTLFFRRVADVDTGGAPYAVFSYIGLLPWTFFSSSVSNGGQSLVTNASLLNKVYCPREVFPLSSIGVSAVDGVISTVILGVLFLIYGVMPEPETAWVPVLLAVQLAFTTGVTLIISAVLVYLRDLRQALPMVLQLGLFASPVAYGIEAIPESYRFVYAIANPLGPVIDGYRRTVLNGQAPQWEFLAPAAVSAFVVLVVGYLLFKRLETRFADVA